MAKDDKGNPVAGHAERDPAAEEARFRTHVEPTPPKEEKKASEKKG